MMKLRRKLAALTGLAVAAAVAGSTSPTWASTAPTTTARAGSASAFSSGSGQSIVAWNQELVSILKTPGAQPATVHPTRSYAIVHAAIYDAVVSITHADRPYLFEVNAGRGARPDAAADQAAHDTLVALYPSMKATLDQMLDAQLAALPSGPHTQEGIRVGRTAAALMLGARANDGSSATPPPFVAPPAQPGNYQITPPNFPTPVFTNWGTIAPFVLNSSEQFRPPPPPALTSDAWANAINEVKSLGRDTSTTRTADETTAAKFWAPPIWNTWNEIASGQATARHSDLEETAKMFAALNLTLGDTTIAFYDAKYQYLFWRPITAIRSGTPGNPAVTADPTWNALANTAPDPSYPGAHSSISEAAATVLTAFFGRHVDLTVSSDALAGVTRQFPSFQAAATEAGLSRIFAGQHTRIDHQAGLDLGADVAHFVLASAKSPGF
ncbi:MAG TPA: vanadium-dependent haloperoxidase [Acidimicrobiales bacterium]|nr:vanadium-dependent haloperoxidase [Acidimicrobiales bacterium]